MKNNKKANVGNMITLIVGVAVSVLVLIFVGSLGGQTYNLVEDDLNEIGVTTITGDTFVGDLNANASLDHASIYSATFVLTNGSNRVVVHSSNYTLYAAVGRVKVKDVKYDNDTLTASYDYEDATIESSVKNGIISGFGALEDTGGYLPIIVLAVVITLVLGYVLSMGGNMNGGNGRTPL